MTKQYNDEHLNHIIYPTHNLLSLTLVNEPDSMSVPPRSLNKKVLTASSNRRRPLDISNLPYDEQKKFFRFDREFDRTFQENHNKNIHLSPDQLHQALDANLRNERVFMFKAFMRDRASKRRDFQ